MHHYCFDKFLNGKRNEQLLYSFFWHVLEKTEILVFKLIRIVMTMCLSYFPKYCQLLYHILRSLGNSKNWHWKRKINYLA